MGLILFVVVWGTWVLMVKVKERSKDGDMQRGFSIGRKGVLLKQKIPRLCRRQVDDARKVGRQKTWQTSQTDRLVQSLDSSQHMALSIICKW